MKIELTIPQAQALLNLIDLAVKAGGLQVASTAVFFQTEISRAFKEGTDAANPVGLQPDGSGPG